MISLPEEKVLYTEIQKKLFYIIPEKWESIFLYASVIDVPNSKKPVGEMYFYYLPKSIIKTPVRWNNTSSISIIAVFN